AVLEEGDDPGRHVRVRQGVTFQLESGKHGAGQLPGFGTDTRGGAGRPGQGSRTWAPGSRTPVAGSAPGPSPAAGRTARWSGGRKRRPGWALLSSTMWRNNSSSVVVG